MFSKGILPECPHQSVRPTVECGLDIGLSFQPSFTFLASLSLMALALLKPMPTFPASLLLLHKPLGVLGQSF